MMMMTRGRRLYSALALMLLAGCATSNVAAPYDPISDPGFKGPTLQTVRSTPGSFIGNRVRWGGTIAKVDNRRDATWIEVVAYPLASSGQPAASDDSAGRFMARVSGFLDPAIYAPNRALTVVGILEPSVQQPIGEYPYRFPVVAAQTYKLWNERQPQVIYYPDPFWDGPFGPWGGRYWGPGFYFGGGRYWRR